MTSTTWHPACLWVRTDQYDDLERRSLAVLQKLKIQPSPTVFQQDVVETPDQITKLRGFVQFLLEHECYDDCLPIFYPYTPSSSCTICPMAAVHYMYRQCSPQGQVAYDWETHEEVHVVQKGEIVPLLGSGEWRSNTVAHLESFTAALLAMGRHDVVTTPLFLSAKTFLQQNHPPPSSYNAPQTQGAATTQASSSTKDDAKPSANQTPGGTFPALPHDDAKKSEMQPAGEMFLPPPPGPLVTPAHPISRLATTPPANEQHLAAVSNAFVLHHLHNATTPMSSDSMRMHSTILLQSLTSLLEVKQRVAMERVQQNEAAKVRLLLQKLQSDGVDPGLLEQHVQAVYGSTLDWGKDAAVYMTEDDFDVALGSSSPSSKRAKWDHSELL